MGSKWSRLVAVIMISMLVLGKAKLSNGCWDQERTALLDLKSFFGYDWIETGSDCCKWKWVKCNVASKRVTRLDLGILKNNYVLAAYRSFYESHLFNASIFLPFEDLRILDLSSIGLVGSIESEGFEKLSKLRHLQFLYLFGNHLNGNILSSLSKISTLKSLSLGGNDLFTGSIHTDDLKLLSRLINLEILDLSRTNMNNNLLLYLGGFSSLTTLLLQENNLEGTVYLQDIHGLKMLNLSQNRIESLRSSNGSGRNLKLMNIKELDLSYNLFNNSILAELGGLLSLKYLSVRANQLHGSINVKEFCGWSNLETLDLSQNEVNQIVTSKENGCLKELKLLYLDGVSTKGNTSLVSLLEAFPSVQTLLLRSNYFSNETVLGYKRLQVLRKLEKLIMDYTPLNINFLEGIGIFTSLKTLSLYGCRLTGSLPAQGWCDLKSLEELSLSGNGLVGSIPWCLGNLTSVRYLDLSYNFFTGNVASTPLTNLSMLRLLAFSNNHFQVPPSFNSFANLSNLKVLIASENKLAAEPANSQTLSPKFQLRLFDMSNFFTPSNCEILDEQGRKLQFPSFLYYQYDLRYIDITGCSYGGGMGFPHWLAQNNTKLEDVLMSEASIEGPLLLPSHPNPNLLTLDLSMNELQHEIQRNFCSVFPNLQTFYISYNSFNGSIPVCLGEMKSLIYLEMSYNNFFGEIPKELGMSRSLLVLNLANNTLSGKISPELWYLFTSLGAVFLRGNKFEGEIPDLSTATPGYVGLFHVSDNHFSGKLPKWLWRNTNLWLLALSNNHFEGSIPIGLCNLVNLAFLDLSGNHLSGTLPSCSNLLNVEHVNLRKNKLSGPLSPVFNGSSYLATLDLSENNVSGRIPDWVGSLSSLSVLLLKANQFDGEFPLHLCRLYRLSILDLSQNKLCGHIPSCLSNLTFKPTSNKSNSYAIYNNVMVSAFGSVLADMRLSISSDSQVLPRSASYFHMYNVEAILYSTKKQVYPYAGIILDLLCAIDLSLNRLTGTIPPGLGNLSEIQGLNLSHNNLTGHIPSTFSKLKNMESLDLSYNNLNGIIPPQLTELTTLEVFSVSHNNLSGPLPDRTAQFGTFDESSYEGNPLLCGLPLNKSCNEAAAPPAIPSEEEHGVIDMVNFYVSLAVSYAILFLTTVLVLYINPYWRRASFSFVKDRSIACYYFIVDTLCRFPCFRRNI